MQNRASIQTGLLTSLAGTALLAMAPVAQAHHAMDGAMPTTFFEGLLSGFAHPVIGIDHFAFLIVVAMLSAFLSGSARFLVPLAFVGGTLGGTLYHLGAGDLPMVETVIALSVLLGGLVVLLKGSLPGLAVALMIGAAGVFHGYAYGESIVGAEQTPLLAYLAGFALIQYAVILAITYGLVAIAGRSQQVHRWATRVGGLATTATGAVFLAMNLA